MVERQILSTILMFYVIFFSVFGLSGLASYILKSLGMYQMGKNQGLDSPWMAFVPYARTYFQGELAGTIHFKKKQLNHPGAWMLGISIGGNVISGALFGVMYMVMFLRMFSQIRYLDYLQYADPETVLYTLMNSGLGSFFVMALVVVLFSSLLSTVLSVLRVLINRQIFAHCTTEGMSVVHAVCCIFIPLYEAIALFVLRNRGMDSQKPHEGPDFETSEVLPE